MPRLALEQHVTIVNSRTARGPQNHVPRPLLLGGLLRGQSGALSLGHRCSGADSDPAEGRHGLPEEETPERLQHDVQVEGGACTAACQEGAGHGSGTQEEGFRAGQGVLLLMVPEVTS